MAKKKSEKEKAFIANKIYRHLSLIAVSFCCLAFLFISFCQAEVVIRDPKLLRDKLEEIRIRKKLPALAASIVIGSDVVVASAVGVRKWGQDIAVTRDDPFELGSISKPITGTLLGILKEQGVLDWDTTIGEIFPEMFPKKFDGHYRGYRKVTIRQLMTHYSGLRRNPKMSQSDIDANGATVMEQRVAYVSAAISNKPEALPGTKNIYSGGGIIATSMAERLTGKPWEELVSQHLFSKLDMQTADFGPMASSSKMIDAPWYHQNRNGVITPIPPETQKRINCKAPIGSVHCSVIDLGRFAAFHLLGMQGKHGKDCLIKPEGFEEMYTPVKADKDKRSLYVTVGFRSQPTDWAKGLAYWHSGQRRGCGHASLRIVPEQNYGMCVLTNVGGNKAVEACSEVHQLIIDELRKANHIPSRLFVE